MSKKLLMTGQLYPADGIEGCKFTVEQDSSDREGKVAVTLLSPYGKKGIVERAACFPSEVADWLLARLDY